MEQPETIEISLDDVRIGHISKDKFGTIKVRWEIKKDDYDGLDEATLRALWEESEPHKIVLEIRKPNL